MRYNEFTMLPEQAFKVVGKKMTLEGGGGGKSSPPPPPAPTPAPPPEPVKPFVPGSGDKAGNAEQSSAASNRKGTSQLKIDLGGASSGGSGLNIPT